MNTIRTLWTKLDPAVRRWLLDNPGCEILPRTLVNQVEADTGETMDTNEHGHHWFSGEELVFLRARHRAEVSASDFTPHAAAEVWDEMYTEPLDR